MAETSLPWDGVSVGDATLAPYDAPTEWAEAWRAVAGASAIETNLSGVLRQPGLNTLNPSSPLANTIRIDSGIAITYGTYYKNSASIDTNVPTPAVATRVDRFVLRKSWSAQTVRLTKIAGVEGGGAPAITQVAGTTWDQPICQVSITTGGVITITDERQLLNALDYFGVARYSGAPNVPTGTKISLDTLVFQTYSGIFQVGTPNRLTAWVAGVYEIGFHAEVTGPKATVLVQKNGVVATLGRFSGADATGGVVDGRIYLSLAYQDYVEFFYTFTGGGNQTISSIQASMKLVGIA